MGLIGPAGVARRHKRVGLSTPGVTVPDGDGGYTQTSVPLEPPFAFAHVRPVTARDMERIAGSSTLPTASHLVTLPYHPQVTTETVLELENHPRPPRTLKVVAVANPDERNVDLELICAEQVS